LDLLSARAAPQVDCASSWLQAHAVQQRGAVRAKDRQLPVQPALLGGAAV
jgi:hypothetical protein